MPKLSFNNVAIRAISAAVPSHVQKVDTSVRQDAKFVAQMGIAQRHISLTEQTSLELGYTAIKDALAHVGWQPKDLDLVIFNSQFHDFNVGDSFLLQKYLPLSPDCIVFDQIMCCAALPYVLSTACSYLQQPNIRKAAIVLGDTVWSMYPSKKELLCANRFIFGDGAAVVLLEQSPEAHPMELHLYADGTGFQYLFKSQSSERNAWRHYDQFKVPDGNTYGTTELGYSYFYMNGFYLTLFASKNMSDQIKQIWGEHIHDYDYYAFHQGNKQIVDLLARPLHLPQDKVLTSFEDYGNTNGGSPLITLCHRLADNSQPLHIFSASLGGGLAWGYCDLTLDPGVIRPIQTTDLVFDELFYQKVEPAPDGTPPSPVSPTENKGLGLS